MRKWSFCCAVTCALVSFAGCWQKGPNVVTAEGTILLRGVPLEGANLTVQYPDGNVAQDVSHTGGKFALTYLGKPGALPGRKLRVSVFKADAPYSLSPRSDSTPQKIPPGRMSADDISLMKSRMGSTASAPAPTVNAQYELTIPDDGSNALLIELP